RRVGRGGLSAMIFPEGTRARVGELGAFKPGGTTALLEEAPDTPVVPVAIDQSWRLLAHNFLPVPWGVRGRAYMTESPPAPGGGPAARPRRAAQPFPLEQGGPAAVVGVRELGARAAPHRQAHR